MIPIHLSIQGLYSYQDKQEVDFTRLTEAGLFGIFGAVGSGKTSILEAMSLCLYGDTERFNQKNDNRYYNMLNLKVNKGLMSFTFLAGKDAKKYQVQFSLRRNSRNFEDVKLHEHLYYLLEEGQDPKPVEQKTVWEDLGISYNNFKRTLVIPQGQFREFLELKPKERTDMLKELFGLHRFDMGGSVAQLAVENKNKQTTISGALSQLSAATEEELQLLTERLSTLTSSLEQWKQQQMECSEALKASAALKELSEKRSSTQTDLAALQKAAQDDLGMIDRINRYEHLRERFATLLRDLDQLEKEILMQEQMHQEQLVTREKRQQSLTEATAARRTTLIQKEAAEAQQPRADELSKMANVRRLSEEISTLQTQISKEEERIGNGRQKIQAEEDSIRSRESEIDSLQPSILPDERVTSLRIFYTESNRLKQVVVQRENEYKRKLEQHTAKEQALVEVRNRVPARVTATWPAVLTEAEVHTVTEDAITNISAERASLRTEQTVLAVRKGLWQYAEGLVEGEPCILCGATHHPNPLVPDHQDAEAQRISDAMAGLDAEEKALRHYSETLKQAIRVAAQSAYELNDAISQLQQAKYDSTAHLSAFSDPRFRPDDEATFRQSDEASTIAKAAEKNAQESIRTHRDNIGKWTKSLSEIVEKHKEAKIQLTDRQARYDTAVETLVHLDLQAYLTRDISEIERERTDILAAIEQTRKAQEAAEQRVAQLERELVDLSARIEETAGILRKQQERLNELRESLEARLLEDGLPLGVVRELLQWQPNLVAIRKEIDERNARISGLKGQITLLEQQMGGRIYDPTLHQQLDAALQEADREVRQLTESRGATDQAIRKMREDMDTRRKLEAEYRQLDIRGRDIATLQEMFRASGFVDFVSRRYLDNVVGVANKRFRKMVRDKFSIELSKDGDFLVRDYLNDGKTRLLKSLSGGQTFQAALCLALALSENIQHTAGADQHFFFIDEGFGSLDSQSLETVFATLRSLQQERKAVGVISHVAELQQGMDIYLHVENDPETGTRVRESWKDVG